MKKNVLVFVSIALFAGVFAFTSCKKTNTTPPTLTLKGLENITISLNAGFYDQGALAENSEGDYVKVKVSSEPAFNKDLVGTYVFTYSAFDVDGNLATATRTVIVRNDAQDFEGTYSATDDGIIGAWHHEFTATLTASHTINNRLMVDKFAAQDGCQTYVDLNWNHTANNMVEQNFWLGSPAKDFMYVGNGPVVASPTQKLFVNYTRVTGIVTNTGVCVFTKGE